jgi:hypothetical protein
MGRTVAVAWHALFSIGAGVLYFFFVLPRWPELLGDTSTTLGTALRIVTGALIALAALPVVFTLLRTRRPEYGTPRLALTLRSTSIVLHVLAGVLIIGTAISEIWISLDSAGQVLFGSYGAAAAIALLGIAGFYLAFVAELPPPPPRPLKPKTSKGRRRGKAAADQAETSEDKDETAAADAVDEPDSEQKSAEETPAEITAADEAAPVEGPADEPAAEVTPDDEPAAVKDSSEEEAPEGGLRNRRPSGKLRPSRRRRRSRGGVAVED